MTSKLAALMAKQKESQANAKPADPGSGSRLATGLGSSAANSPTESNNEGNRGGAPAPDERPAISLDSPAKTGFRFGRTQENRNPEPGTADSAGPDQRQPEHSEAGARVDAGQVPSESSGPVPPSPQGSDAATPAANPAKRLSFLGAGAAKPAAVSEPTAAETVESRAVTTGADGDVSDRPSGGLAAFVGIKSTPHSVAESAPRVALGSGSSETGAFSLDDIANFEDNGEVDANQIYQDMIPADMPDRELPEEMTEGMQGFLSLIETTYQVLNEPDVFGPTIRNLMIELQENPEYDKLLVDADVNTMMRGLRQSMGMAQIKKQATKRTPKKKEPKDLQLTSSADAMFGEDDWG